MSSVMPTGTPEKIGRFKIERVLGKGAQGIVYLAFDEQLGRSVAIKTLHLQRQETSDVAEPLLRQEARVVGQLNHPNIVSLHDAGEESGIPYLVFEYVAGEALGAYLGRSGKLSEEEAAALMIPILRGLNEAHKLSLVHGDLNPANILLNDAGTPRITDFGISAVLSRSGQQQREVWGSPQYMSPEHFSNEPITPRSDIFAAGMLLYEMVTGSPAYSGSDSYTVMYKIANQPIVPPSRLRDGLPTALERIILKALGKKPEQRYADAEEMAQALEQFTTDAQEQGGAGSGGTLEFLLRRMRHKKDFPAISRHIIEINNKSSDQSRSSASALSNTILKDYSLTTKLLRLVNSSYYGQYGGRISTISRAVVILGFEQVRMAALSLILFEHLQNSESANVLKDYAVGSMVSGLLARDIASEAMSVEPEEAFICAMFHKLGRQLALYYFPEEYEIIQSKLQSGKLDEDVAAKSVLGVTYEEIGIGVAEYWKFPEKVVHSMRSFPAGKVERPGGAMEVLRTVSVFSNELQAVIGIDEEDLRSSGLKALLKRHDVSLPMGEKRVDKLIERTAAQVVENAELFGISGRNSSLVNKLNNWNKSEQKSSGGEDNADGQADSFATITDQAEGDAQDQASIFINGIQDVTNAMMDETPLNDILVMVMETMYRGVGFNRTMLCIANPKTKQVQARFGFGADIDELLGRFAFKLNDRSDPFVAAMLENRDQVFNASTKRGGKDPVLPDWHRKLVTPARVLLLPIVVNKRPLGLFYADYQSAQRQLTTQQLNFLRTLRNQAILAVKQGAR